VTKSDCVDISLVFKCLLRLLLDSKVVLVFDFLDLVMDCIALFVLLVDTLLLTSYDRGSACTQQLSRSNTDESSLAEPSVRLELSAFPPFYS
jgi:hypothetical protein